MSLDKLLNEKPDTQNVSQELTTFVRKIAAMDMENLEWVTTALFQQIIDILGTHPPLGLVEEISKHYKGVKQKILTDDIPTLLNSYGLAKATTTDGLDVKLERKVNVKTVNKLALNEWLVENGYSDMIKHTLTFPKGEINEELQGFLSQHGYSYSDKEDIHYQTLNKIVRDRIEDGEDLPKNSLEINVFDIAKIK